MRAPLHLLYSACCAAARCCCWTLLPPTAMLTVQRPCLELTANRAGDVAARVAVTGGIVIPLWAAGSPKLDQKRVHEEEVYTYANPRGKVGGVQNIHNPSLEAHVPTPLHICVFILTPISQSTSCEEIFRRSRCCQAATMGRA